MYKVYVDAGHNYSGVDTGAVGFGIREQDISYYIAAEVKRTLNERGVEVKMSREKLTDNVAGKSVSESLSSRYSGANTWGADVFVSIHCNAGGGTGSEVYCYNKGSKSELLAKNILTGLMCNTDLKPRGVKTANYAVLKNTTMPAALVETAFIDNANDAKILGSESGRGLIAKGISEGILEYLGVKYSDITIEKLTTPNDIVWELSQMGLVSDVSGMIAEMEKEPDGRLYWLARKVVNR